MATEPVQMPRVNPTRVDEGALAATIARGDPLKTAMARVDAQEQGEQAGADTPPAAGSRPPATTPAAVTAMRDRMRAVVTEARNSATARLQTVVEAAQRAQKGTDERADACFSMIDEFVHYATESFETAKHAEEALADCEKRLNPPLRAVKPSS